MDTSVAQNVSSKLASFGSKALFKVKNASPEILVGAGIISIVAGTVLACKATLKADQILDDHAYKMDKIKEAKEKFPESYTQKDELQDKVETFSQTSVNFIKLYWPSAIFMVGGVACLLSSHGIMKQRNAALAAAYAVVDKAFKSYRSRVTDELGKDKDYHFMHGTTYQTITEEVIGEEGKKKKVKTEIQINNPDGPSMYARYFDKQVWDIETGSYTGSSQWCESPSYNASHLVIKNGVVNDQLKARGYVFLNDVYDELGFPRTKAGQVVGWVWQGDGDNYISFGPTVDAIINKDPGAEDLYLHNKSILVDFNVDGVILDLLK